MTTTKRPRPTSSHLVPTRLDDLTKRPRPSSPSPTGDEVAETSTRTPHQTPTSSHPTGRPQTTTRRHPMTTEPMSCHRCGQTHVLRGGSTASCAGHKRDGEPCGQPPMTGQRICRKHGGKAPQNLAAAQERVQEEKAQAALSELLWDRNAKPVTSAVAELQLLAGQLQHSMHVLGSRLNSSGVCELCHRGAEPMDGPTGRVWLAVVREQRQLLSKMEELGIAQHQLQLDADQIRKMAVAMMQMFAALELDEEARARGQAAFFEGLRVSVEDVGQVDVVSGRVLEGGGPA